MPYIASVFLHILFAAFWMGGMLFLPLVFLPGIKNESNRVALLYKTGIRFRLYGWVALAGLLITGLLNMYLRGIPFSLEFLTESGYGRLLAFKLILFSILLMIAFIHDFYIGEKAIELIKADQKNKLTLVARWSGRINLLLSVLIAFLGVAISRGGWI
ncbi:MAG: CopD family protein [Bacteroidia bacterium]|nr:CopD family protein [Bacteroidia bacterium]